jgi:hypothetical protein
MSERMTDAEVEAAWKWDHEGCIDTAKIARELLRARAREEQLEKALLRLLTDLDGLPWDRMEASAGIVAATRRARNAAFGAALDHPKKGNEE